MKYIICLAATFVFTSAFPQNAGPPQAAPAPSAGKSAIAPAAAPAAPIPPHQALAASLGPQFYGPGLNNPHALPPNQFILNQARSVIATNPNLRVRVLTTGEVEFTDQFGREIEGGAGFEILDPEERFQMEFEARERQFELEQERRELQARHQLLQGLLGPQGQGGAGIGGANRFAV